MVNLFMCATFYVSGAVCTCERCTESHGVINVNCNHIIGLTCLAHFTSSYTSSEADFSTSLRDFFKLSKLLPPISTSG